MNCSIPWLLSVGSTATTLGYFDFDFAFDFDIDNRESTAWQAVKLVMVVCDYSIHTHIPTYIPAHIYLL